MATRLLRSQRTKLQLSRNFQFLSKKVLSCLILSSVWPRLFDSSLSPIRCVCANISVPGESRIERFFFHRARRPCGWRARKKKKPRIVRLLVCEPPATGERGKCNQSFSGAREFAINFRKKFPRLGVNFVCRMTSVCGVAYLIKFIV
jgi:hypothetical protein